ncbi:SCO family protein [Mesobaculum littorinae]|uniref:SCO family protein n=1 Tax=Mesobaculum littorinae TaxID=2486419 RepID=A0A438AHA5_9RHOB|nr:SCO family protein [Mesobaculum littorinae]RVV98090.1 SCO family protein [Mesobaculum littorinae]
MLARIGKLRLALWVAVAVALAAILWLQVIEPRLSAAVAGNFGRGDYELTTTDGDRFTEASLKGAPSAVFFGFTHCPEVCPTTLGDIATWQDALAEEDRDLRVFFVTVDPERDTADVLGDYVSWVPGVAGVTGSRDEIDKAIDAFHIYARKVPLEGGDYTMDHSANVLLFDAEGRLFEPIGYGEGPDRALDKLRRLFAA